MKVKPTFSDWTMILVPMTLVLVYKSLNHIFFLHRIFCSLSPSPFLPFHYIFKLAITKLFRDWLLGPRRLTLKTTGVYGRASVNHWSYLAPSFLNPPLRQNP